MKFVKSYESNLNIDKLTGSTIVSKYKDELNYSKNTEKYHELLKQLINSLNELSWKDIDYVYLDEPGLNQYYPVFPANIVSRMKDIIKISSINFRYNIGTWYDIMDDLGVTRMYNAIHFNLEKETHFNRSHFPDGGIPMSIRGIGLGYKLYRALIHKVGYMSSDSIGTLEKDRVWKSIISYKSDDSDVHAIVGLTDWLVIDKSKFDLNIINIIDEFIEEKIKYKYTIPNKFDIDNELINKLPDEILKKLSIEYLEQLMETHRISANRYLKLTEIKEMGISNLQNINNTHIGRLATNQNTNSKIEYDEISNKLLIGLTNLQSEDISFISVDDIYYPIFPRHIIELYELGKSFNNIDFTTEFGRWNFKPNKKDHDSTYLKTQIKYREIKISELDHTIQLQNFGEAHKADSANLLYKIYLALLKKIGYFTNIQLDTAEQVNAFTKLLEEPNNLHIILGKTDSIILDHSCKNKLKIAEDFIQYKIDYIFTDPDEFDMDDALINELSDEFLVNLQPEYLENLVNDNRISKDRFNDLLELDNY